MGFSHLKHLLVQLQAVAEVVEHLPDLREGNRKALSPQGVTQVPQALGCPPQRGLGIPVAAFRYQALQSFHDPRLCLLYGFSPSAFLADPARGGSLDSPGNLPDPRCDGVS